jgi:lipopolysaccharide transport system ATP-binding protein
MSTPIISVKNLSKRYVVGHRTERYGVYRYTNLRDFMMHEARIAVRKAIDVSRGRQVVQGDTVEEFWALKDISFEVQEGEVLGIVGRNGAGKSTLLKILSRITEPTAGRIVLRGRVASLLEVGTGFHPELSGRENIYLNGAILGMSRGEIRRKFDEIVAFAEIERFLDTPVKRYSSGMYVRLAFAVAAHLEPEILIVDEVLAVGDAEFQKKCLGKMEDVSRRGRTVLLVSHNMGVITKLCATALWLDKGSIREYEIAQTVVGRYLAQSARNDEYVVQLNCQQRPPGIEGDRFRFRRLEWLSALPLRHGEPAKVRLYFDVRVPLSNVSVAIAFNSIEGGRVLTYHMNNSVARRDLVDPGIHSLDLIIDSLILGPAIYRLEIASRSGDFHLLDAVPECGPVEVIAGSKTPSAIAQTFPGVRLEGAWSWDPGMRPSEEVFS